MFDAHLVEKLRAEVATVVLRVHLTYVCLFLSEHGLNPEKLNRYVFSAAQTLPFAKADPSTGIGETLQERGDTAISEKLL